MSWLNLHLFNNTTVSVDELEATFVTVTVAEGGFLADMLVTTSVAVIVADTISKKLAKSSVAMALA